MRAIAAWKETSEPIVAMEVSSTFPTLPLVSVKSPPLRRKPAKLVTAEESAATNSMTLSWITPIDPSDAARRKAVEVGWTPPGPVGETPPGPVGLTPPDGLPGT
jgi:hypothetical protein